MPPTSSPLPCPPSFPDPILLQLPATSSCDPIHCHHLFEHFDSYTGCRPHYCHHPPSNRVLHCGSDCGSGAGYRFVDISSQLLDPRTGIVDTRYVRRRAEASGGLTDEPVRHARCWHSSHYAIARLVLSFAAPSLNARTRRTYTCAMSGSPRCTRRPTPQWGLISTFRLA